jgi:subtilisin family serine protease
MKGKSRFWFLAMVICLLFPGGQPTQGQSSVNPGLDAVVEQSLQATARTLHINRFTANLRVAESHAVQVSDLAFTAYAVKILDPQQERLYQYWYDAEGRHTTEQAVFDARAAAYVAKYGHLSRSLFTRLSTEPATTTIPVAVWAEQPLGSDVPPMTLPHKLYLPLVMRGSTACGTAVECVVQFIQSRGYAVDYVSIEAPVVYATIPSTVINELQSQYYVAAIYEQESAQTTLYSAARTAAAHWTWPRGITGNGVTVAVLEVRDSDGMSGIALNNPYVGTRAYFDNNVREGNHATQVAGVIASTHPTDRGVAYGATLLSANVSGRRERHIIAAADWALDQGADVINASFGTSCGNRNITSLDKYFDWIVWDQQTTAVVSAGNLLANPNNSSYCPHNYNVTAPGKAYNVITVGAKDDKNTAEAPEDTQDDQFCAFSLYVDPETTSSDRLKPEVVAVGQRVNSTIPQSPWIGTEVAGTSFSAPIVAGQAALMMQRRDWLTFSPEAVKAGIMTTARWTSLKDDANPDKPASIDKMGVGAVDTTAADNSLINERIQGLYLQESDFTDGHYDIDFEVTVPERIRVIIVWSSHPSRVWITNWILHDRLESDFDLTVRAPNGQVFGSYADEANYEIVEFQAPVTGMYRARIHLSRWDNSSMEERVGFAWYSGAPLP